MKSAETKIVNQSYDITKVGITEVIDHQNCQPSCESQKLWTTKVANHQSWFYGKIFFFLKFHISLVRITVRWISGKVLGLFSEFINQTVFIKTWCFFFFWICLKFIFFTPFISMYGSKRKSSFSFLSLQIYVDIFHL